MARGTSNRKQRTTDQGSSSRFGSRRTFLQATAGAGALGLAGCLSNIGGGGGGSDTITYGVVSPMSGAYSSLAPGQRNGAKLAIETLKEDDEFDFEIEGVYADGQTEDTASVQAAERLVQEDGANFIMGCISSSVALAMNEFAAEEQVIYNPGAAAVPITGSGCNEYVFRAETNTAQIAEAVSEYTVNNLGTEVWFHIADYAYGTSVRNRVEARMRQANSDLNVVGSTASELGSSNFDTYISQIDNSDAEVVVVGMTGGDLINFTAQAVEAGLTEDKDIMAPTMTFQVVRGALGSAAYGLYGGVRYVSTLDNPLNNTFREAYMNMDETSGPPDNFARVGYQSIMMTAEGIKEAGSTNVDDVIDALAGLEMDSILGNNQFRACDHQALNPTWMGRCVEPSSGEVADVELLKKVEGPDAMIPCEETECSL
ncbi:ABC transporter substrate-binding protein [Haloarchaeobius iranensis]|uniref:Amino acid/amide ABC transporter substrate-binding protein, HAAT family n=1 Tax=Haloarchaeobius iranensis TaxID=996166 RepID=A0A1H0ASM7_9EURY|nr:ABC transporter substrate-binding protein [Haloarchaeobius iranensis]SDN36558.1 amino acid/amide ABC transporter substrate-binding protein, HAAT family [Haloarchaeobius iranensis]